MAIHKYTFGLRNAIETALDDPSDNIVATRYYASFEEFNAKAKVIGPVYIAGRQYWYNGSALNSIGSVLLAKGLPNVEITNNSPGAGTLLQMHTITIPGGAIKAGDILRLETIFTSNSDIDAKEAIIKMANTSIPWASADWVSDISVSNNHNFIAFDIRIVCTSSNTQILQPAFTNRFIETTALSNYTINMDLDWNIHFGGKTGTTSGAHLALTSYTLEVL